jgi:hypothetical protein
LPQVFGITLRHAVGDLELADGPEPDKYDIARFFSKVNVRPSMEDCWEWKGSIGRGHMGYGSFSVGSTSRSAHRFCYEYFHGRIPEGLVVRHRCDNPLCVNPWHLETGTHKDNMLDRVIRNRSSRGSKNGNAKLTEDQVLDIFHDDRLPTQISEDYGIDHTTVRNIKSGKNWTHLTGARRVQRK